MNIYRLLILIFLPFLFINGNRQTKLEGKTYVAEIGATCKDGIGMIYTSRILKFDKNTVTSSYKVVASVSKERKNTYEQMYDNLTKVYKWKIEKNVLIFENCKEFGTLKIQNSKIIGYDNDWMKAIEFKEQTK
ncbi:hypothetical protein QWZ06_17175 [Chryseobacterium tructae]|uniref:Uncharacterized protein n=1 Tax=Chryseobacterium tructae TaxID=1037380 RepID=A0ABV7XYR9_9FLAO|nr:hypothetical protein [Chryseobacterium tructae]MDN3693892.1 hypothetical protein [Chryseobacterium tructae]